MSPRVASEKLIYNFNFAIMIVPSEDLRTACAVIVRLRSIELLLSF